MKRVSRWAAGIACAVMACSLVVPVAVAAPSKVFRSCIQLRAQYPEGVARDAASADAAVKRWMMRAKVDPTLYARNSARLDKDGDGILCAAKGPRELGPPSSDWVETDWCESRLGVADLAADYDPANPRPTLLALAERRYPPAVAVIDNATDESLRLWLEPLPGEPNNLSRVQRRFESVVHEEGHLLDLSLGVYGSTYAYRVVDDSGLVYVPALSTFPRSEILRVHPDPSSDMYANTYLMSPGANQDVEMLVEEFVQYVHSLASGYCAFDIPRNESISYRDGVVTFMWWIEMYLAVGREFHPDDYAEILSNKPLLGVILDTWDRAEYWLLKTRGTRYGMNASKLTFRAYDPDNVIEIDRLRQALSAASAVR